MKIITLLLLLLSCFLGLFHTGQALLDSSTYPVVRQAIFDLFCFNSGLQATSLRLSFHDCASDTCDGCINLDNGFNSGLAPAINHLEWVRNHLIDHHDITMPRSDLWALAGQLAAEWGMEGMPGAKDAAKCTPESGAKCRTICHYPDDFASPFTFVQGRVDCPTSPSTDEMFNFPPSDASHSEVFDYFADEFDMTPADVVAIMGAHTLGRARYHISGHFGPWIPGESTSFDNNYYKALTKKDIKWNFRNVKPAFPPDARAQFYCPLYESTCVKSLSIYEPMMLITDFNILYDSVKAEFPNEWLPLETNPSCTPHVDCTEASTADQVHRYAESQEEWISYFNKAFHKMVSRGYPPGSLTPCEEV